MRSRTIPAAAACSAVVLMGLFSRGQAAPRHPPVGSYQATCSNISFSNAGVLTAQCKDVTGRIVPAVLRMPDCGKGDIANTNGRLTCPPLFVPTKKLPPLLRGPQPRSAPFGPGSLILYDGIDYKGRAMVLASDESNLDLSHFNDQASSVRVKGGSWQLCVDSEFRGHCTVVDKDSPNLTRFGINNRVSSIRRVG
jgi:hypothetical protein